MISLRLKAVADFIEKEDKVIDIACDHALLDVYLVKEKGLTNIIVSDINQNALDNAIYNIKKNKLNKKITSILSDGLYDIDCSNHNTIIISGLGTKTIINILKNIKKIKNIKKLVIQTNNDYYYLRSFITRQNFYIKNENITTDNNKKYITIEFIRGKKKYSYQELLYGPILIKDKNNQTYFQNILSHLQLLLSKIPKSQKFERNIIIKKIKALNKILK